MSNLPKTIWTVGIFLLCLVNIVAVAPKTYLYKLYFVEVYEPDVRVFQSSGQGTNGQVKVLTGYSANNPVYADHKVSVSIDRKLMNENAIWYSTINLVILISTIIFATVAKHLRRAA